MSSTTDKLPWMKFYPKDWVSDACLQQCSIAARGLWMHLICMMHQSPKHGYLEMESGRPLQVKHIARCVGEAEAVVVELLAELEENGVFSRDGETIYSRRMIRDAERVAKASECGRKGGNPRLKIGRDQSGFVYAIRAVGGGDTKIGSSVDPKKRAMSKNGSLRLGQFEVVRSWPVSHMGKAEAAVHELLKNYTSGGEWFRIGDAELDAVEKHLESLGYLSPKPTDSTESKGGVNPPLYPTSKPDTDTDTEGDTDTETEGDNNTASRHAVVGVGADAVGGVAVPFTERGYTDAQCDAVVSAWNDGARARLGSGWAVYKAGPRDRAALDYHLARLASQATHAPQDASGFVAWVIGQIRAYWASPSAVAKDATGKMFTCSFKGFIKGTTSDGPKALEDPDQWGDRKAAGKVLTREQSAAKAAADEAAILARREQAERDRAGRGSIREAAERAARQGNALMARVLNGKDAA